MPSYKQKKQKLKELVKREQQQRKRVIQQEGHKFVDTDAFKRSEKHYKYYMYRKTDYSKLVRLDSLPMREIEGKKVYIIDAPQGAYLVKKFNDVEEQYQIGFQALNRYICRPYRTNLDGTNGLYEKEEEAQQKMTENLEVQPDQVKDEQNNIKYYFNERIRMTNLGYQYDWPKRSYPSTKVPVPDTILRMTDKAIDLFQQISGSKIDYKGEAVIVNFYKQKDYMTGHLDDGEIDQVNPIFSFCFGLSCVFLLGFPQKQRQPLAIQLEAGDLMIMSGFSRICYHGVPRIIQNSYKIPTQQQLQFELKIPKNSENIKFINQKHQVLNYFVSHRLNVNIRQVYPSHAQHNTKMEVENQKNKTEQCKQKQEGQSKQKKQIERKENNY